MASWKNTVLNLLKLVVIRTTLQGAGKKVKRNNNIPFMESEIRNNSSFHSGHRRVSLPKAKTHTDGRIPLAAIPVQCVGVRGAVHWISQMSAAKPGEAL